MYNNFCWSEDLEIVLQDLGEQLGITYCLGCLYDVTIITVW